MSSTPLTGDRSFRDDAVRVSALTVNTAVIDSYVFTNCRIIGPAVFIPLGGQINHCAWEVDGIDDLFWDIPPTRSNVVGAVAIINCIFSNCRFEGIGLAGPPEFRSVVESWFTPPLPDR